jgi:hypothetical protein
MPARHRLHCCSSSSILKLVLNITWIGQVTALISSSLREDLVLAGFWAVFLSNATLHGHTAVSWDDATSALTQSMDSR